MMIEDSNNAFEGVGYDARNIYPGQVVYRLHLYLDCKVDDVQKRLDLLGDLIDVGSIYIKDKEVIRDSLEYIDSLLNPRMEYIAETKTKLIKLNIEPSDLNVKAFLKRKAKILLTKNCDKVFAAYDKVNLFVPKINRLDPNRSFAGYD